MLLKIRIFSISSMATHTMFGWMKNRLESLTHFAKFKRNYSNVIYATTASWYTINEKGSTHNMHFTVISLSL